MKKIKILALIALVLGLVLAFYEPAQKELAKQLINIEIERKGLNEHTINVDDNEFYYLDNENFDAKDSIVFIHGFGGDSINWAKLAPYLTDYRVVALDLIGFGKSEKDAQLDYHFIDQANRVLAFTEALGIKNFHVAGNSMGGGITLAIAINYPEKIKTATLFNAAGVNQYASEWYKRSRTDDVNELQTKSPEDFEKTYAMSMSKPPFVPWPILKFRQQAEVKNHALKYQAFHDFARGEQANLIPQLSSINLPVLIIWGNEDKILDVGNADIIEQKVANSQKVILDGIGHLPMMEAPEQCAKALLNFIEINSQ